MNTTLETGQWVKVTAGEFAGVEGKVLWTRTHYTVDDKPYLGIVVIETPFGKDYAVLLEDSAVEVL